MGSIFQTKGDIVNISNPVELGEEVKGTLDNGSPYVHIEGLPFIEMDIAEQEEYIKKLSGAMGELTLVGGKPNSEIWRLDKTTSPSSKFIPFHTDNAFLKFPERIVGFWNLKSSDNGGENLILPVVDLLEWLEPKSEHKEAFEQLSGETVEFSNGNETANGHIIDPVELTTRFDMKYIGAAHEQLGKLFRKILAEPDIPAHAVKLQEGDVLFFNNVTTLHARNEYTDPDRVSLRVRM